MNNLSPQEIRELKGEAKSFSIAVPSSAELRAGKLDVAQAQLMALQALRELSEAIPNGQRQRTLTYLERAKQGLIQLEARLAENGVA